jgi:hypothetical protein
MTNSSTWLEDNLRYLTAALTWLRLRLELCAEEQNDAAAIKKDVAKDARGRASKPLAGSLEERVAEALVEMEKLADKMASPPALILLAESLGLSKFEQEILLLCAAMEFDSSIPHLCARIVSKRGGPAASNAPTFAVALTAFEKPAWDALSPDAPLRYWRLLEIDQPGSQPLTASPLRADERIVGFLKGLNRPDDRLALYLSLVEEATAEAPMPASQQIVCDAIVNRWKLSSDAGALPLIQLLGPEFASKQVVAAKVAKMMGTQLYRITAEALPAQAAELELLSRLWQRESRLMPTVLLLQAQTLDPSPSDLHAAYARRFLARLPGRTLLATREGWSDIVHETFFFDVAKPTREEQRAAWLAALGAKQEATAGLLAAQFNLTGMEIQRISQEIPEKLKGEALSNALWESCLMHSRPLLDRLAHRIDCRASWDEIVLPEPERQLLQQIRNQVTERNTVYEDWGFSARMSRGRGISVLFAGESGTGKTMAAEVIANALHLNLYRIDLSAVVSKYIGETEKNLRQLFDAAENGGAILFFDEADALFGKRSEVKDSHDRYANIEINYLLQRMEAYSGLAILATNMRSSLDVAFTRRLRFIVNFPFPSVADRKRMWQKAFPAKTPLQDLDYDRLAKFNLTGGSISNAAINSAFLAAQANGRVTMAFALAAIRQELIKLDRPLNEADFVWAEETSANDSRSKRKEIA